MSGNKQYSFSNKEDVYNFLDELSFVYEFKEIGDDLSCFYLDFVRLMDMVQDNKYIKIYHDVQTGKKSVNAKEASKPVKKICAERLSIPLEKYEEKLEENVLELCKININNWINYINKKYKNKIILTTPSINQDRSIDELTNPNNGNSNIVGVKEEIESKEEEKERYLSDLYEFLSNIESKIKQAKERGEEDTSEYKKLVSIRIDVLKDINIIRRSYGEVLGNQNSSGRRSFVSYDSENPEYQNIISEHEGVLNEVRDDQLSEQKKQEKLKLIKNIAKKVLTNRQYIIFEFYYFNGLTQQEIADLMGVSKQMINKDIPIIVQKIKASI